MTNYPLHDDDVERAPASGLGPSDEPTATEELLLRIFADAVPWGLSSTRRRKAEETR